MKVIDLPILVKSTQKDGILLRLRDRDESSAPISDAVKLFFGILADYVDPDFVSRIIFEIFTRAQKENDLDDLLKKWKLPSGTQLVAIAPEYVPPKMRVKDPSHPHYQRVGEILYGEGDTLYLWVEGQMISANLDQLERV